MPRSFASPLSTLTPIYHHHPHPPPQQHKDDKNAWIVMADEKTGDELVYDITNYMHTHPGGVEILMEVTGKCMEVDGEDATEMFDSIGHTSGAKAERNKYIVGKLKVDPDKPKRVRTQGRSVDSKGGLNMMAVLAVLIVIAAGLYYQFMVLAK